MTREDASKGVPWELDMDTAIRIMWISAALGLVVAVVSGVGLWRGWWS